MYNHISFLETKQADPRNMRAVLPPPPLLSSLSTMAVLTAKKQGIPDADFNIEHLFDRKSFLAANNVDKTVNPKPSFVAVF